MAWTYSGDPASSDLDLVRFLIGDTDSVDPQLQNAEVNYEVVQSPANLYLAAVRCVQAIIAKYARLVSKSVGDLSLSYSERLNNYKTLLDQLMAKASITAAPPYAGGISISDKEIDEEDTDRVVPAFTVGMMSNRGMTDTLNTEPD